MIAQVSTEWQQENQLYLMQHLDRLRFALERAAGGREGEVWGDKGEGEEGEIFSQSSSSSHTSHTLPTLALEKICQSFGLSTFERDILLLCAGVELDASFGSLIADIQGDSQHNYPTFSLALAVLESAYWGALTPESPLRKWRLIEIGGGNTLTTSPLRIDEKILHYLTGIYHLDSRLKGIATLVNTEEQLVPSHQQLAMQMVNTWYLAAPEEKILPILQLCGKDSASQRAIASIICSKLNFLPYIISVELLPNETENLNIVKSLWEREFTLNNAALLLEWDNYDGNDPKQERAINQFIETIQAPIIIISQERRGQRHRSIITFDVDSPTSTEQRLLWQQSLKEFAPDISEEVENLVSHFNLSTPAIRSACLKARSIRKEGGVWEERGEGEEGGVISQSSHTSHTSHTPHTILWDICRNQARPRLDELAQRMDSGAEWDELVLPIMEKQVLRDAADQLRQRTKVYEEWGFGGKGKRGLGISALFAGGSGTGKTMAAEVLAQEMRLDLYRIDLSAVVSKYIGETEKNLGRVFDAAETGGVILLFDEADAIFGKRSEVKDARDRHANMEVAYLLQRMEAYPGLSILTTNLKNSIDQAFLRRIRFIVQFPFPDATQRAEIWRRVFPKNTPTQGLDERKLARLNVAGGNIRNIALNAAFIAAQAGTVVQMQHILQATKSEYTKMERPLTDNEVKGWV
ncbi:MAG: ATP-binding protein, partial [Cyanobacteria bacterium P01_A01_bin.68]